MIFIYFHFISLHLVDLAVSNFFVDLVPPFFFLKWNYYFSACKNLLNCSCHFWKLKSVFLQILHQSTVPSNINLLCFFRPNIIYFGQKESLKWIFFWSIPVLGSKFVKFWCQFWNGKSIPPQILHLFSLPWYITPL